MGRYNFAPLRHRSLALQKLDSRRITQTPTWYNALTAVPVSQILVRQRPIPHPLFKTRTRAISAGNRNPQIEQFTFIEEPNRPHKSRKKSRGKAKLFKPVSIKYEEDSIRTLFYSDHPWELARPRMVLEQTGNDANTHEVDWSTGVVQPGKSLNGESCIQRTLHLLQNEPGLDLDRAYDKARKEFYSARLDEDVERRIAPEEASHFGVDFGPGILERGMRSEDKAYENWREWAIREQQIRLQARGGAAAPRLRGTQATEDDKSEGGRSRDMRGVRGTTDDYNDDIDVESEFEDNADDFNSAAAEVSSPQQQAPP